jgi:hypothetical protein
MQLSIHAKFYTLNPSTLKSKPIIYMYISEIKVSGKDTRALVGFYTTKIFNHYHFLNIL